MNGFSCCVHDALKGIGRFADDGEVVNGIGSTDPFQEIPQRYFTLTSIELQQFAYWNCQQIGCLTDGQYPVQSANQRLFPFHIIWFKFDQIWNGLLNRTLKNKEGYLVKLALEATGQHLLHILQQKTKCKS